jgi:hypothetical protein
MSFLTFDQFRMQLEGYMFLTFYAGLHIGAHPLSVGGEMSNFFSSPAGPTV